MQDVNKRNGRDRGRVYRPLSVLSVQCFCKSKTAKALRLLLIQDIKGTLEMVKGKPGMLQSMVSQRVGHN